MATGQTISARVEAACISRGERAEAGQLSSASHEYLNLWRGSTFFNVNMRSFSGGWINLGDSYGPSVLTFTYVPPSAGDGRHRALPAARAIRVSAVRKLSCKGQRHERASW